MTDDERFPIIEDPLAWQARIDYAHDHAQGPINVRGSARFWYTVAQRGLPVVWRNGAPDFSEIVFDLGDGLGLQLTTNEETNFIRYRFVDLKAYEERL